MSKVTEKNFKVVHYTGIGADKDYPYDVEDQNGRTIAIVFDSKNGESQSNAALLAAAPEMLAFIQKMDNMGMGNSETKRLIRLATSCAVTTNDSVFPPLLLSDCCGAEPRGGSDDMGICSLCRMECEYTEQAPFTSKSALLKKDFDLVKYANALFTNLSKKAS